MRFIYLLVIAHFFLQHPVFGQSKKTTHPQKTVTLAPVAPVNVYAAIDSCVLQMPDSVTGSIEGIAAYINGHFKEDLEKARAAFVWVASNIQYDINNMFAMNRYEKEEAKIIKVLQSRKGICEHYALLFQHICKKTGIKSYTIDGYTRQHGFVDYVPHGWCAVFIDDKWYLVDPTWGAGSSINGKFVKGMNNRFFLASGEELIRSHMPFDDMWQLLPYPVSGAAFQSGKTGMDSSRPFFNYEDSIAVFEKQDRVSYYLTVAGRIERNEVKNALIFNYLQYLHGQVENKALELHNAALLPFNDAVAGFNEYINYYNKQFKPEKVDADIQAMISNCTARLKEAGEKLDEAKKVNTTTDALIDGFRRQMSELSARINEEQAWLIKYFSKGKLARRFMFRR